MSEKALGTKLNIIGALGVKKAVGSLKKLGGIDMKAGAVETTTLDCDGYKTFIAGLKETGDLKIEGNFDPDDTDGQMALLGKFTSGVDTSFEVTFESTASWEFSGFVSGFSTGDATPEGIIPFSAAIKISGAPVFTPAA